MNRLERALCHSDNAPFIGVNINTWEYSMLSSPEITVFRIIERLIHDLAGNYEKAKKVFSRRIFAIGYSAERFL